MEPSRIRESSIKFLRHCEAFLLRKRSQQALMAIPGWLRQFPESVLFCSVLSALRLDVLFRQVHLEIARIPLDLRR